MAKGLKSVSTLSAKEIAEKHGLSLAYIAKQIVKGVKVEKEHTKSTREANEIARDHLGERPDYYIKLDKMEKTKVINELGEYDNKGGSPVVGDLTGSSRKVSKVDEGKRLDKAKKAVMAGVTAANMYTLADVAGRATEGGHGSPKGDIVRAATALPGAAGWGATAVHYGKKGYDAAKEVLKKKKSSMEEETVKEDLRKWFREKWVRYDTKGNIKGPCAREEGEGKPKCRPLASARAMSKDERAKSARRKRREDPVADRPGKGGKPIMVNTNEETLLEKNVPTNPELWARAKSQAKAKFDVYPSAYANGWASKWYKSKGGGWKSAANESVDEACWDNYKQEGMKKKGNKMVPNCVPVEEQGQVMSRYTERPTYESRTTKGDTFGQSIERGIYEKQIDEISAELVGKVSNARFWRGEVPSKTLARAINKKFIESGKKKDVKKQTVKEETMDTKEQIHEAIGNIMEENLHEMKENFLAVLQEKAIEKLEERKKEIAANYFGQ